MTLNISKTLFSLLLLCIIFSVVVFFRPELPELIQENRVIDKVVKQDNLIVQALKKNEISSEIWMRSYEPKPFIIKEEKPKIKVKRIIQKKSHLINTPSVATYTAPQPVISPPFSYLGGMIDNNHYSIFLLSSSGPMTVQVGQIIEGQWKLIKATSMSIDLMYLPTSNVFRLNLK